MINCLYILGNGSQCWNLELKYSLRSLEKYCRDVGKVYIAGLCPDFIDKRKVKWLDIQDVASPRFNHWWKVSNAFKQTGVKEFLLMYDDIFFVKPTELSKYPYYYSGVLKAVNRENNYHLAKEKSHQFLTSIGESVLDLENHCPIRYNKNDFEKMEDIFKGLKNDRIGLSVRSMYGNMFAPRNEMVKQSDLKIREPVEDLEDVIKGRDCFSISATNFYGGVFEWLKKELPNKSKWER